MKFLQEKAQITVPGKENGPEAWATFGSVRQKQTDPKYLDELPPGMDITAQQLSEQPSMPLTQAGSTDPAKVGNLDKGYGRLDMKGTDDLYTGEHADLFYGDAGGFVERNNYLDRN